MEPRKKITTEELKAIIDIYDNFQKALKKHDVISFAEFASMHKGKPFTEDRNIKMLRVMLKLGYIKMQNKSKKYPLYITTMKSLEPIHARAIVLEIRNVIRKYNGKRAELNKKSQQVPKMKNIPAPPKPKTAKTISLQDVKTIKTYYILGIPVLKVVTKN